MKKLFCMLLVCGFLICAFVSSFAEAQQLVPTVSFQMGGIYAPAKFIVEFSYCQNFSGPLNMQTLSGSSLWTSSESPIAFEFDAKDVDTYTFDIELQYNASTDQVLSLSYWSGTLAPCQIKAHIVGTDILVHFQMVVNTEPVIPSKEAIAEAVVMQVKQDLADYQNQVAQLTDQFQQNIMTMWAIIVVALLSSILSLIVALYAIRSAHQERRR